MKRILFVLILMLCLTTQASANKVVESARGSDNSTSISVSTTGTIYTKSFPIYSFDYADGLGVVYSQTPATGDTILSFEQSVQRPDTEGASDSTYLETIILDSSVSGTGWQMATIDTVNLIYGRFKIKGQGSNPATTVINIKYVK